MRLKTQIEIEEENRGMTQDKMYAAIEKAKKQGNLADLKSSQVVAGYYITELARRLSVYQAELLLGYARVKPIPAKLMLVVSPEIVAHYTVLSVINLMGRKGISNINIYHLVGKQLELEYKLGQFKGRDKKDHKRFIKYINTSGHKGHRKVKITGDLLNKYHSEAIKGDMSLNFVQLAQVAVHILAETQPMVNGEVTPPLVTLSTINSANKSVTKLVPSDWFLDWTRQQVLDGNMLPNFYTPLVEPPKPWTNLRNGGFHSEYNRENFIKTYIDHDRFNVRQMEPTMRAVNSLQETPWQVNERVLEVMNYAFVNKLDWGDLPVPSEVLAMPFPYPNKKREEMTEEQLKTVKAWTQHKAMLHDENVSSTSKYLLVARALGIAKRFLPYPKIYFAYNVDFRGRIYPISGDLHPQGSQHVKALLQFANGKKITTRQGEMYLALQGANTYGKDKIRLEEKYAWVLENHDKILASAQNPISENWWKQADEPWLFLAFCFEWQGYSQDPKNYESRIPIALDGSCNGLQHLSAMLRDEVGGKAVNLTANYNKEDIYNEVRLVAIKMLEREESPLAKRVLEFGIERSTCKRPVMIVPYAGTQNACRKYIGDDLDERGGKEFFGEDYIEAQNLITHHVWQAIAKVVIKGREIMQWFKETSRIIIKSDYRTELEWVTPNGFQVIQRRVKLRSDQIQTNLGETIRLTLTSTRPTDRTDVSGHTTAVSPNFIHSLDACALQNTVNACVSAGIPDLAMIHDSYGSHAETAPKMAQILREEFVKIYRRDVLQDWIDQQPQELHEFFPALPTKGELDLEEVLSSEHFFS